MEQPKAGLAAGVDSLLMDVLALEVGERLLVYAREGGAEEELAKAIQVRAEARGNPTELLVLSPGGTLAKWAETIAERIRQAPFHAVCELTEQYFYLTPAWEAGREKRLRLYSLAGLDTGAFIRCVAEVDQDRLFEFGKAIKRLLDRSRSVRITTSAGTDIRMRLEGDPGRLVGLLARFRRAVQRTGRRYAERVGFKALAQRLRSRPRGFVFDPSGRLRGGVRETFLGGQLAFRGLPETIEGTAIIDGCFWPPPEIGRIEEPISLKIERGSVVGFGGCAAKARLLRARFEGQPVNVEHFCLGFNPGARIGGRILEAERVMGALTVGIGQGPLHADGVLVRGTVRTEQDSVLEDGVFVHQSLAPLVDGLTKGESSRT